MRILYTKILIKDLEVLLVCLCVMYTAIVSPVVTSITSSEGLPNKVYNTIVSAVYRDEIKYIHSEMNSTGNEE